MTTTEELSAKECAEFLGVSYLTLIKLIKRRQLLGFKKGGVYAVPLQEARRFKAEGNHPDWNREPKEAN